MNTIEIITLLGSILASLTAVFFVSKFHFSAVEVDKMHAELKREIQLNRHERELFQLEVMNRLTNIERRMITGKHSL